MPAKGNWKKPFEAALKALADSKAEALKECAAQIFHLARNDSIIYGATEEKPRRSGRGTYLRYNETEQMNRYSRPKRPGRKPRRIFSQTKFVDRTGNLAKSLTPAGGWSGNALPTRGEGSAIVVSNETETYARLVFTGKAEGALSGGDSKKGRGGKIRITDEKGNLIAEQTARGRRRPIELAARKASRVFEKAMKAGMGKREKSIS